MLFPALFGGGETGTAANVKLGPDKHKKSVEELDAYSKERWDSLLSYLARETGKVSQAELEQTQAF